MISNRFAGANNRYMDKKYEETLPSKFITYLDANNIYGWAMCQNIPVGNFKWMTEFENWRNLSCILEVDLEYP